MTEQSTTAKYDPTKDPNYGTIIISMMMGKKTAERMQKINERIALAEAAGINIPQVSAAFRIWRQIPPGADPKDAPVPAAAAPVQKAASRGDKPQKKHLKPDGNKAKRRPKTGQQKKPLEPKVSAPALVFFASSDPNGETKHSPFACLAALKNRQAEGVAA